MLIVEKLPKYEQAARIWAVLWKYTYNILWQGDKWLGKQLRSYLLGVGVYFCWQYRYNGDSYGGSAGSSAIVTNQKEDNCQNFQIDPTIIISTKFQKRW